MFGVLNIHKPAGCTSHDVVAQVRRTLGFKKVGHAGTLDPLATGVLPVCVGQATRLIEYFPSDKRYQAVIRLGATTFTWDREGEEIPITSAKGVSEATLLAKLPAFTGKIQQTVPPHAAVHVNGKKLYEYARQGITVDLPVREIEIYSLDLLAITPVSLDLLDITLDIHCASGTYVRSLAFELGQALGTGGYLASLVRTAHGQFSIEDSVLLEDFAKSASPQQYLQNPAPFLDLPTLNVAGETIEKVHHGLKLTEDDVGESIRNHRQYLLLAAHLPLAIAQGEANGRLKLLKVFPQDLVVPV